MIFVNAVCPGSLLVARNFSLTGFRACRNDIFGCGILSVTQSEGLDAFSASMSLWGSQRNVSISVKYFLMFCSKEPEYHFLLLSLVVFLYGLSSPFFPFPSITFFIEWLRRTPSFFSLCYFCVGQTGENDFLPWSLYHVSGGSFGSGSSAVSFPTVWYGSVTFSGLGDVSCCSFVCISFVYLTWV